MLFPNNDDLAHWAGVLWNNLDLTSPFFADLATLAKKKSHISLSVLTSAYAVQFAKGRHASGHGRKSRGMWLHVRWWDVISSARGASSDLIHGWASSQEVV